MDIKDTINERLTVLARENLEKKNILEKNASNYEKATDEIFCDFLSVIDTFERAEEVIKEKELDKDESAKKAITRLLNAKKKALSTLNKHGVEEIVFPNNISIDSMCVVNDTEPDASKETGTIISIEKKGYTRKGHLLRPAEVIIVKN